jgi:peptidoglycan/xylan/chitin deacetylase (PgdA/CDA1 family)
MPTEALGVATIKSVVKSGALALLAGYAWLRIRLSTKPTLLILTYHRILPSDHTERDAEQPGMIASPEALERHINLTRRLGAEPMHLSDWLARHENGEPLPRLAVAFTFDDGWRDNYQHAFPTLQATATPATIFLVSKLLDTNTVFWPEQVIYLLTRLPVSNAAVFDWLRPFLPQTSDQTTKPLTLEQADGVISRLKALDDATIIKHLAATYAEVPELADFQQTPRVLASDELMDMSKQGLVRYGGHTRHHYRLNLLNDSQTLKDEIVGCLEDIRNLGDAHVPVFCYPNGDISNQGEQLVATHYRAACTTETGWNQAGCDPFKLRRFNLHDGNSHNSMRLLATLGRGLL